MKKFTFFLLILLQVHLINYGMDIKGNIDKDSVLTVAYSPYNITGDLYIRNGATLTIQPGVVVNFGNTGYELYVGYSSTSKGTLIANNVTFNGFLTATADEQIIFRFNSAGNITNCTFNNVMVGMNESSPTIQNVSFQNVTYPIEFVNECSPVLNGILISSATNKGIKLSGTVNVNWTLQNYGLPYYIASNLIVNSGATLTIAKNDTLKFPSIYPISVGSSAASIGHIIADSVFFKGYSGSVSDRLNINYGSTGTITHCDFEYLDVLCLQSSPSLSNCSFYNAAISMNEASPVLQNISFENIAYPLEFINECTPTLGTLSFTNVTNKGIEISGTINSNYTLPNYGYPYFVTNTLTVNTGATLTIAANDTLKFTSYDVVAGSSATSLGNIIADGVHFYGNTASANDQLVFSYGSTGNINNCRFIYADLSCSLSAPTISNCIFTNSVISLSEASPVLQNLTFENVAYPIEFINECTPTLGTLIFNNVTNKGIELSGVINSNYTLPNYGYPYFLTASLTVNAGATLTIAENDTIKFTSYDLIAGSSASSLGTINANRVIFQGNSGSTSDQVVFSYGSSGSITNCIFNYVDLSCSVSSPNISNNIFRNAAISLSESSPVLQNITFENVTYPLEFINECTPNIGALTFINVTNPGIEFSGTYNSNYTLPNYGFPYYLTGALTVNTGSTFTIAKENIINFVGSNTFNIGGSASSLGNMYAKGVHFKSMDATDNYIHFKYGSTGTIDSCILQTIRLNIDASSPVITNCKIHKSQNAVYLLNNALPQISNNTFYNNHIALKNAGALNVNAENNFWGHFSGPVHPDNTPGLGDKVEGLVNFTNYSSTPLRGIIQSKLILDSLDFGAIKIGSFKDLVFRITSLGDVDLLITDIVTSDPSFKIQLPTNKRVWLKAGDTLNITARFMPERPISYSEKVFNKTNILNKPIELLKVRGTGLPILTFSRSYIDFDTVYVRKGQLEQVALVNVSGTSQVKVDSVVNYNSSFIISWSTTAKAAPVKSYDESQPALKAAGILSDGFSVVNTAYLQVEYRPYKYKVDYDTLLVYYASGGKEKIIVRGECFADSLSARILSIDAKQFPYIYMNVAIDTLASPITTLTSKEISIFENGVLQTGCFKVTPPGEGDNSRLTDIIFLMDNSGSMGDEQLAVRNNVFDFLNSLSSSGINYALGLCRYGSSTNSGNPIIEDMGTLTSDANYFKNSLWALNNTSGSFEPGYYAITQSSANFKFRPGSQKVFIIITDETPLQGSAANLQKALNVCVNQKITLYALTVPSLYSDFMPIANATNGRVFNILSKFDEILAQISSMVSSNYLIQYCSDQPVLDGLRRNVEVKVNYKGFYSNDTVSYIPGAIPKITRTQATLDLHKKAWGIGTAFTIEAEITDALPPYVNDATLYYKVTDSATYQSVKMTNTSGSLYSAVIPDTIVKAPGIDYYITASDGITSSDDPAINAIKNPYQIAILPNEAPLIVHTPVIQYESGIAIHLQATVTDNTNALTKVELYYRKQGQLIYTIASMSNITSNIYEGVIPQSALTGVNIEYYIRATDDLNISSYSTWPSVPHIITPKTTGILVTTNDFIIEMYPNPVWDNKITIRVNNSKGIRNLSVKMFNSTGILMGNYHNGKIKGGENIIPVALDGISSGIYYIEIYIDKARYYKKIIKN